MVRTRSGLSTTATTTTTSTTSTTSTTTTPTPTPMYIPDGSEIPTGTCVVCGETFRVGGSKYGHTECCDTFLTLTDQYDDIHIPYGVRAKFVTILVETTDYVENSLYGGYDGHRMADKTYQLAVPAEVSSVNGWIEDKWDAICDYSGLDYDSTIQYIY